MDETGFPSMLAVGIGALLGKAGKRDETGSETAGFRGSVLYGSTFWMFNSVFPSALTATSVRRVAGAPSTCQPGGRR